MATKVCIPTRNRELQGPAQTNSKNSPLPPSVASAQRKDWADTEPLVKNGPSMFQHFRLIAS